MKVLITGANGQLGQEIAKEFGKDWVVVATDTPNLDITNKDQVELVIKKEKPNWVIHCAAWTNVDAAAENPKAAMRVNGEGTKNICEAARKIGAKVIYISTNEVFDGKKKAPYVESDEANPVTAYGESKLAGERFCQEILGQNCIIVRTSWLYGPASSVNFPNKIISKAKENGFLKIVDDEISTPTYTPDLARAIKELIKKDGKGVFHLVNQGSASRFEWGKLVINLSNMKKIKLEPIKLKDFERPSKPPANCVLQNVRGEGLNIVLRPWEEACSEYIESLGSKHYNTSSTKSP